MGAQMIRSIHLGMGEIGEKRLKLYKELAEKRGKTIGALIIEIVDRELGVNLPKTGVGKSRRSSRKK